MTTAGYVSRLERRLALAIARGDRIGAPALRARIDAETRAPLESVRNGPYRAPMMATGPMGSFAR